MKRLLSLLLCLFLLVPALAAAEEEDIDFNELVEEDVDLELDENGDPVLPDDNDNEDDQFDDDLLTLELEADDSVNYDDLEINANLPGEDEVFNILLIGVDYREYDKSKSQYLPDQMGDHNGHVKRSDVIMILSINIYEGTLKITSISRDLKVQIPGIGKWEINNAFAVRHFKNGEFKYSEDKPELLLRTVNHNFDMNLKYYVATNFFGVEEIIESLGGVDLEMTKKEAKYVNSYIKKNRKKMANSYDLHSENRVPLEEKDGIHHLDGLQGLVFARYRSISNETDLARSGRTRRLMQALTRSAMEKMKSMNANEQLNFIIEMTKYFKTNLNLQAAFTKLWPAVKNSGIMDSMDDMTSLIEEHRIPADKEYHFSGSSVIMNDQEQTKEELHEFIYGAYYPAN